MVDIQIMVAAVFYMASAIGTSTAKNGWYTDDDGKKWNQNNDLWLDRN